RAATTLTSLLCTTRRTSHPTAPSVVTPPPIFAVGANPHGEAVGDFNGDGKADIALATQISNTDDMTLLLGNGNGTFQAPVTTVTDTAPVVGFGLSGNGQSSIATADFNGDGRLDLVVVDNTDFKQPAGRGTFTSVPGPGVVSVLLGNGNGTFQAPRNFAVGSEAMTVAVGDFN